jgi:hypothetical protein
MVHVNITITIPNHSSAFHTIRTPSQPPPSILPNQTKPKPKPMCTQTRTLLLCARCRSRSYLPGYGPRVSCGLKGSGILTPINPYVTSRCPSLVIIDREETVAMCHNCPLLEAAERRAAERASEEGRRRVEEREADCATGEYYERLEAAGDGSSTAAGRGSGDDGRYDSGVGSSSEDSDESEDSGDSDNDIEFERVA